MKLPFQNVRKNLSKKDTIVVKICVWAGLLTWMVFYLAFAIVMAKRLASLVAVYGRGTLGEVLVYVAPIWLVFTVLLTIVLIARWAKRKLS